MKPVADLLLTGGRIIDPSQGVDEIADIAPDLPKDVMEEVVQSLPLEERDRLRSALSYPEGTVGALMNFDHVAVREDVTLEAATSQLRRLDELVALCAAYGVTPDAILIAAAP